jgi:hypothetical protein
MASLKPAHFAQPIFELKYRQVFEVQNDAEEPTRET